MVKDWPIESFCILDLKYTLAVGEILRQMDVKCMWIGFFSGVLDLADVQMKTVR